MIFFKKSPKTEKILKGLELEISKTIERIFGFSRLEVPCSIPTDKTKADLVTNISFIVSKEIKKNPVEVAQKIVEEISKSNLSENFEFEAVAPGFINIKFKDSFLNELMSDIESLGNKFGNNNILKGKNYVIEHTSPNPNKAMHVGHLRNNLIGMSLVNVCKASGAKVVSEAIDNDRGIAIAKAMWGFLISKNKNGKRIEDVNYWHENRNEWFTPEDLNQKSDHFVDECYLKGSEDFKSSPESEKTVRDLVVKWESKDLVVWNLWELIIDYAHGGMKETLDRIGNHWDLVWHEHEHYEMGKDLVEQGLEKGVFKKLEDGAVLTDLEKYNIPDTILLKSDGTSLYITQDIALTKLKKARHKADKLFWVIGPEQSIAMKQVFACCEQLGIGKIEDFIHIPYGLVNIKDQDGNTKKMSSRGGEVVHIDTLINTVKESLLKLDRDYSDDLAEKIAIGAIKYSILRASRNTNVVLDIENSINLNGDSGVYLMYAHARIKSLVDKAPKLIKQKFSFDEYDKKVLVILSHFPMVIENAVKDYTPNLIVDYMLELSQAFNTMYGNDKFISEDLDKTSRKISISKSVATVMANAFSLIGIDIPERV